MPVTTKVSAAVTMVFVILCAAIWFILALAVAPSFDRLEHERAAENHWRAVSALERELRHLDAFRDDYGEWQRTHRFMQGDVAGFVEEDLDSDIFADARLQSFVFIRPDGAIAARVVDENGASRLAAPTAEYPAILPASHPLMTARDGDGILRGIHATAQGPVFVSSSPIMRRDPSYPYVGHILVTTAIDERLLAELRDQTRVSLSFLPPGSPDAAPAENVA